MIRSSTWLAHQHPQDSDLDDDDARAIDSRPADDSPAVHTDLRSRRRYPAAAQVERVSPETVVEETDEAEESVEADETDAVEDSDDYTEPTASVIEDAAPDEPTTADEPTVPDEPVTPDEPAVPDEPATPDEPAVPDEPVTPDEPAPTSTTTPIKRGGIRRAPALDGLRGVAVLAVVVYHCFGTTMRGGYLGVDIFFVLSGFLISSLLIREFGSSGRVSLGDFWQRRARRILPAAITVLVACVAVAGLFGGDVAVQLVAQFLGSLLFVNNWVQIAASHSYFADAVPQIFTHYWSLAIEEQFYLIWPPLFILVMWLCRRMPMQARLRTTGAVAIGLGVASVVAMALRYDPNADPSRVYFGSDTHAFGLLAGVALALLITSPSVSVDSWPRFTSAWTATIIGWTFAPLAFAGLVALIVLLPDTHALTYRGGLLLACLLTVAVVHNAVRQVGPVAWLLQRSPLRWLGARSFSIYLWHWPVFVFVQAWWLGSDRTATGASVWLIGAVAVVVSLALSEITYRWVETPFRRRGFAGVLAALGEPRRALVPVGAMASFLAISLLAGVALGQSPAKSSLETDLDQLAELQRQANAAAAAVPRPRPVAATKAVPTGREITGIGDSVMLASSLALTRRFPGMYIDAEVSRHYTGGEPVIQTLAASGRLRKYVVLGFGTNGQAFDGQLDRIVREIGSGHMIILVVPYGPVDGIPQAARQVLQYAPRHPNVYLAPWCQAAAAHPEKLRADGVHPAGTGIWMYADAVSEGLRQAASGTRNTSITCSI